MAGHDLLTIFGFTPSANVQRMAQRVHDLSPRRPLAVVEIATDHHANAGAGIHDDSISMAFRPGSSIDDVLVSHELGHLLIGLEQKHLIIGDGIPQRSPDRRMAGTLLSLFEHPAVLMLQESYGIELASYRDAQFSAYVTGIEGVTSEPNPPMFFVELVAGYVMMKYLLDEERLRKVESLMRRRAPITLGLGERLATVVSPERVERHAYADMLADMVKTFGITGTWPHHLRLMPPARSDG